jgi:hypothetical protein
MLGIIGFPALVQDAPQYFAVLFRCEPQRQPLAEHLISLMIAPRKTALAIRRELAQTTAQSYLNKFLTTVDWDSGR